MKLGRTIPILRMFDEALTRELTRTRRTAA
jgi:hypothetical protein